MTRRKTNKTGRDLCCYRRTEKASVLGSDALLQGN